MATPASSWHRAWGLTIASDVDLSPYLPRVAEAEGGASDITIAARSAQVAQPSAAPSVRLAWQGLVVEVSAGRRVIVCEDGGASAADLAQYLAGPTMGAVLSQRGLGVLHASAVRLDDEVLAFTASSGVGKSTLAAMLADQGAEFLCDDMLVVEVGEGGAMAVVGPRGAKVHREAVPPGWRVADVAVLDGRVVATPSDVELRDGERLALARLCVVVDGAPDGDVQVTPLRGAAKLSAVIQADFAAPLAPPDERGALLERAGRLATVATVVSLRRPRRLDVGMAVAQALRQSRDSCRSRR